MNTSTAYDIADLDHDTDRDAWLDARVAEAIDAQDEASLVAESYEYTDVGTHEWR